MIAILTVRNEDGTERVIRTENVTKVSYNAGLKSILYKNKQYAKGFCIEDKEFVSLEILEGENYETK